jgi:uncharacterized DUF497 family protein
MPGLSAEPPQRCRFIAPDLKHSRAEERLIAIGTTDAGRHVYLAFTVRATDGQQRIRPVSARYMHPKEIVSYEQTQDEEEEEST